MIFWIASYPKSGNTWLRTLISSYYFSKEGYYNQDLIQLIGQFPEKRHFEGFSYNPKEVIGTTRLWIKAQEKINKDKKIHFFIFRSDGKRKVLLIFCIDTFNRIRPIFIYDTSFDFKRRCKFTIFNRKISW